MTLTPRLLGLAFAAASFRLLFGRDKREEEEAWRA